MTPKLTDEMREALEKQQPGCPVAVQDDRTQKFYILLSQDEYRRLLDDELRRELQIGFDQSDRGEAETWDIEATLAEAHRRHAERNK